VIRELDFLAAEAFGRRALRRATFVRRSGLPASAACFVATAIRETLRRAFDAACEVDVGEPVLVDDAAWHALAANAYGFHTRGRQNDAVLLIKARDARRIVLRALREDGAVDDAMCSALELMALERLAGEIADVFTPLFGARASATSFRRSEELPVCTTVFDVRLRAPVRAVLCIALVRDVARPGPVTTIAPSALWNIEVEARAQFAVGELSARSVLGLAVGDVVTMQTKVGDAATLKVGPHRVATGDCGVAGERTAFLVRQSPAIGGAV